MILDKHCFAKVKENTPMKRNENMADRLCEEELESLYSCVCVYVCITVGRFSFLLVGLGKE